MLQSKLPPSSLTTEWVKKKTLENPVSCRMVHKFLNDWMAERLRMIDEKRKISSQCRLNI